MKEFMYYVNGLYFANLKTARKHAQRVGDSDVLLTLGDYDETILSYNPMSERLERKKNVNEKKEKLLQKNKSKRFIKYQV